jgi:cytochrome P450
MVTVNRQAATGCDGRQPEAMTAPVKDFMRNTTADTELRGQKIRAMDRLMLCYPSANRDEEVFEAPDEFRLLSARFPF